MSLDTEPTRQIEDLERKKAAAKAKLLVIGLTLAVVTAACAAALWFSRTATKPSPTPEVHHLHHLPMPLSAPPNQAANSTPTPGLDGTDFPVATGSEGPVAGAPIMTGDQIVMIFAILVGGLLIYGGFVYGRVVNISFEIANTKVHLEAGQIANRPKEAS